MCFFQSASPSFGVAELVADQLVCSFLIRNTQQRLGHAHQQHAFLATEVVLPHEGFDRALVLGACADAADEIGGSGLRLQPLGFGQARLLEQMAHVGGLVAHPTGGNRGAWTRRRRRKFGADQRVGDGR
jgi:hypothetical protein